MPASELAACLLQRWRRQRQRQLLRPKKLSYLLPPTPLTTHNILSATFSQKKVEAKTSNRTKSAFSSTYVDGRNRLLWKWFLVLFWRFWRPFDVKNDARNVDSFDASKLECLNVAPYFGLLFWQKIMFGWTVENLGFWFWIGSVAQVKAEEGEGKE